MKPDTSQWRDPQAYAFIKGAAANEIAWEFLRRNPRCQQDFATSRSARRCAHYASARVCSFAARPDQSGVERPVYWAPQINPGVVNLVEVPPDLQTREGSAIDVPLAVGRRDEVGLQCGLAAHSWRFSATPSQVNRSPPLYRWTTWRTTGCKPSSGSFARSTGRTFPTRG